MFFEKDDTECMVRGLMNINRLVEVIDDKIDKSDY